MKTADDLNLPTPDRCDRADGQPATVSGRSPPQRSWPTSWPTWPTGPSRSQSRAVDPTEDNMLKITGRRPQGRPRPAARRPRRRPGRAGKVAVAADRDRRRSTTTPRTTAYLDRHRRAAPDARARCSSCSATSAPPPATGWNVYDELARQLVDRGVPAEQVRFIHEASNDRREGRAVRRRPRRPRRRAGRVDREDGRRHQRPGPRGRPAPPGLPVAAGRPRTARRPHPAPGQPEPRGRRSSATSPKAVLRHLHVADRRTQGPVHRPGHARPAATSARSTTSATPPCPTPRSRRSPPATR